MNKRLSLLASALLAAATFALGAVATPSLATAQDYGDSCCVRILNNTRTCHITICVSLPDGTERCDLLTALSGVRYWFRCDKYTQFTATGACGIKTPLIPGQCVRMMLRGSPCCADVCLRVDPDGCYQITVDEVYGECPCPQY